MTSRHHTTTVHLHCCGNQLANISRPLPRPPVKPTTQTEVFWPYERATLAAQTPRTKPHDPHRVDWGWTSPHTLRATGMLIMDCPTCGKRTAIGMARATHLLDQAVEQLPKRHFDCDITTWEITRRETRNR